MLWLAVAVGDIRLTVAVGGVGHGGGDTRLAVAAAGVGVGNTGWEGGTQCGEVRCGMLRLEASSSDTHYDLNMECPPNASPAMGPELVAL